MSYSTSQGDPTPIHVEDHLMRTHARSTARRLSGPAVLAALAALAAPPAAAQEPGPPPPEPRPEVGVQPVDEHFLADDAQRQLVELFGRVERRLNEIDRFLSDASAGDTSALDKVGPSGIDELLSRSRNTGRQAVEDIDKILDLANQMNQQCKSPGSSSSCPKPGGSGETSPLDQVGQQQTRREQTPEAPPESQAKPETKNGQKPDDAKDAQKRGEQDPKNPFAAAEPNPRNDPAGKPPGSERDVVSGAPDDLDKWGALPVHARDIFRTQGGGDMPARYRDWIDSYYRRLNERR
jgi:hypothetical protein